MKAAFYLVSLAVALALGVALLIVTDPNVDHNQHRSFAIGFGIGILLIHVVVLVVYPFTKSDRLLKIVMRWAWVSAAAMILMAFMCHPIREIPVVITPESQRGR